MFANLFLIFAILFSKGISWEIDLTGFKQGCHQKENEVSLRIVVVNNSQKALNFRTISPPGNEFIESQKPYWYGIIVDSIRVDLLDSKDSIIGSQTAPFGISSQILNKSAMIHFVSLKISAPAEKANTSLVTYLHNKHQPRYGSSLIPRPVDYSEYLIPTKIPLVYLEKCMIAPD